MFGQLQALGQVGDFLDVDWLDPEQLQNLLPKLQRFMLNYRPDQLIDRWVEAKCVSLSASSSASESLSLSSSNIKITI
jgi:hypothetical protein